MPSPVTLESLKAQFSPLKNPTLDFSDLKKKDRPTWVCAEGHEWATSVNHRLSGSQCPYCGNQKVSTGFNDLLTLNPELAAEWHPTKNGTVSPDKVMAKSSKKFWWLCDKSHEWETTVHSRSTGRGCAVCTGNKVLQGFNDLETLNPLIAAEWHPFKNTLLPTEVTLVSGKKVWWQCKEKHEWETTTASRTSGGHGCPFCDGQKAILGVNDLSTVNPILAAQWHPTLNGNSSPQDFMANSGRKAWWLCDQGHEWNTIIGSRSKGGGCPICGNKKILQGHNDLATLNPTLAAEWHPSLNGQNKPSMFSLRSGKKVWWLCSLGHEWKAVLADRTGGTGCPVCNNRSIVAGFNDLATTYPHIAAQYHPNLNLNDPLESLVSGSHKKNWWLCDKNHEWQAQVGHRSNGTNCPTCSQNDVASKAEKEIADFVIQLGVGSVELNTRKVLKRKELDIYIPDKNIAIEFNGVYWHSEAALKVKNYHHDKWLECKEKGIQLIQIWEDDWADNKQGILNSLSHKLGASEQEKIFARKTLVQKLTTGEARNFLDLNHIQGFASGSYYLGLVSKAAPHTIVAVLVLKKESTNSLNIIRYATAANIMGGFTKLLAYASATYTPDAFITFSDHTISNGGLYANNGFTADKELPPDYMYVIRGKRKHKFGYRLKRFKNDENLLWEKGLTEPQLAKLNNLNRIWDAGKTRWVREEKAKTI